MSDRMPQMWEHIRTVFSRAAFTRAMFRMPASLARYWLRGPGAARIRWGTKGDLTRCARAIRRAARGKIVPGQEWPICQNLHKRRFGVPNPRD